MKTLTSIIIICCLFLASCNSVRSSAGVNRKVIDEYVVVENPPLVIPPNFNLLPPDQIVSKNIEDAEVDLAKEILFGLDEDEIQNTNDNSLMNDIIKKTNANAVGENFRDEFNQDFAGQKSSKIDEDVFESEEEINAAIENTKIKNNKNKNQKKKKRFIFF